MGAFASKLKRKKKVVLKPGFSYDSYKSLIKPFDLILFKGARQLEKLDQGTKVSTSDMFSHAGMIVTSDILDDVRVKPGKLYIWESTMSGRLTDGVKNIDNKVQFGVQLRDFDKVMKGYDANPDTRIAVCHLKRSPKLSGQVKRDFTQFFKKVNGTGYDYVPRSLLSVVCGCFRKETTEKEDNEKLFCSELVAYCWKEMSILPESVLAKHVCPQDFVGNDRDGMPCVVCAPNYITVNAFK
jgi:hypothetical protein